MNRGDWIIASFCALWLAFMAWVPLKAGVTIKIDAPTLEAIMAAAAIIFSSAFAIAVPLIIRNMDAGNTRQDALDAAMDMGRWTFAVIAAGRGFGIMPPRLEGGLRAQIAMAEQRLNSIDLIALRSAPIARRVRQVQRLARVLVDGLPPVGAIDPAAATFIANTAEALRLSITDVARLVERRPTITNAEIEARLNLV